MFVLVLGDETPKFCESFKKYCIWFENFLELPTIDILNEEGIIRGISKEILVSIGCLQKSPFLCIWAPRGS